MKFSYRCERGRAEEMDFPPGRAPSILGCMCIGDIHPTTRDYAADFASQVVSTGDPFRSYHLSTAKSSAAVAQQREIGGPTDNFERRRDEMTRGIQYVGNDTGGMSAAARRGIERAKDKR